MKKVFIVLAILFFVLIQAGWYSKRQTCYGVHIFPKARVTIDGIKYSSFNPELDTLIQEK